MSRYLYVDLELLPVSSSIIASRSAAVHTPCTRGVGEFPGCSEGTSLIGKVCVEVIVLLMEILFQFLIQRIFVISLHPLDVILAEQCIAQGVEFDFF